MLVAERRPTKKLISGRVAANRLHGFVNWKNENE
jgi:hypothetical protein